MAGQRYRRRSPARTDFPHPSGHAPAPPSIDHVQVAAPSGCEAAARAFYGGLIGLAELDKPAALAGRGGVWFQLAGGHQLHVGAVESDRFAPAEKAHPGLAVEDPQTLRALGRRLSDAGAAVQWDETLPGVLRFYTADPWGNRLELLCARDGTP